MQGLEAYAENLGGASFVLAGVLESAQNEQAFRLVNR
jgi:hypothetical protein